MQVGGGAVHTILRRLAGARLVETSKTGCLLTEKGTNLWRECSTVLRKKRIVRTELTLGEHSFAVLIEDTGDRVGSGIEQRDAAIRLGTRSLTTVIFRNKHLVIPSVSEDAARDFPDAAKQIVTFLKPKENNAIILSSAEERKKAEYCALAAAWIIFN